MDIIHPTLLLDKDRCIENIKRMSSKARVNDLAFKPHFKTHQSLEIGRWFKKENIEAITVSSIKMAKYFADDGWQDITIAFPANVKAVQEINKLAEQAQLTLLVENADTTGFLSKKLNNQVNILIEIDAGSKRTGIIVDNDEEILQLIKILEKSSKLNWEGFYSHFGHTYGCRGEVEIKNTFVSSLEKINSMIHRNSLANVSLHIGDTPGCSIVDDFPGVTAITPGNFVFYDVMQREIGSCNYDNIAIAMGCPVVSKKAARNDIIVHGGAVHFSKDNINKEGHPTFGILCELTDNGIGKVWEGQSMVAFSQEHGIIKINDKEIFSRVNIGDVVGILPIHSCLTAECMGEYQDFKGNTADHL